MPVTKHRNPWKGLKHSYLEHRFLFVLFVTKHRNPWKGLKLAVSIYFAIYAIPSYKAQKSLEGIETSFFPFRQGAKRKLQSTEIPGRD